MEWRVSGLAAAVEAVLLVADEPLSSDLLASVLGCTSREVESTCQRLAEEYRSQGRGFVLSRVAGGYRYQTARQQAPAVERYILTGHPTRLSAAALETLAIIAYRQPVSRNQVAAIRGVNPDAVLRTLRRHGYVEEAGRSPGPGKAVLYGTTSQFLEKLGLDSVKELPPLEDFVPRAAVVETLERELRLIPDTAISDPGIGDTAIGDTGGSVVAGDVSDSGGAEVR